ncbi:serine hydrolase domain-containing protein [Algoriphagus zhangzhouensis]|uniref:CubicO group peptidase, beta-lactamase class C family n=1 Tax=Algoriphagus zhangzhouensis TaxID=1073327 RepID=A0A1M7ZCT3_9BACT|nr:serine hydrolase [Algoriphagus zhangzhouensis]TDY45600.1 CubicO group peptidase (beta-lactamase class C family) [Algoriphagus zhangzhouensis]SHO62619.1 CubicO group peptidase, beta-lactamase class C family [Algoriphagus zhangzhouensis]
MKHQTFLFLSIFCLTICACSKKDNPTPVPSESVYFPPINSSVWETQSIQDLEWDEVALGGLLDFLEENNTKGFIILHQGKLVVEEYMNDHSINTPWYWASAGKTLTSTVTGITQDQGLLDISRPVSDYLGTGWTSTPLSKEALITSRNLLSMTSGIDDSYGDDVSAENLHYKADTGTRWAYHNVYVKLQDVVAEASGKTWDNYFKSELRDKIGMTGAWVQLGNLSVYFSDTRSMARFGLMIFAGGKWENDQIISQEFLNEAINTSQNINLSYGYLWWLNGKSSFHLPQSQLQFPGSLVPTAPLDMYAALGKNDQKIYIVPSEKLVIIRLGESPNEDFAVSEFDREFWNLMMEVLN